MTSQWKEIAENTYALRVFLGWIVETRALDENGFVKCSSSVFVPDENGDWMEDAL